MNADKRRLKEGRSGGAARYKTLAMGEANPKVLIELRLTQPKAWLAADERG